MAKAVGMAAVIKAVTRSNSRITLFIVSPFKVQKGIYPSIVVRLISTEFVGLSHLLKSNKDDSQKEQCP